MMEVLAPAASSRPALPFIPLLLIARQNMIQAFACAAGWQQLYQLWELIVLACKFLWDLLRLLGGGG
jgi:hypothetical protein